MSEDVDSESSDVEDVIELQDAPVDPEDFIESLDDADDEVLADAEALIEYLTDLEETKEELTDEVDELTSRLKRAHADFENYKKRIERRRQEAEREAIRRLVEHLVDLREDLQRAVSIEDQTAEDIAEGVKLSLNNLDRLLDAEDVERFTPEEGTEVDPHRHEVMVRVVSDEHPAGTIAEVFEPGYLHGDRVLREAQVAVSSNGKSEAESVDDGGTDSAE